MMKAIKKCALICFIALSVGVQAQTGRTAIDITTDYLENGDTVTLVILQPARPEFGLAKRKLRRAVTGGQVSFGLPSGGTAYKVSLLFPNKGRNKNGSRNRYGYFISNGDHIVYRDNGTVRLDGPGAGIWKLQDSLQAIERSYKKRIPEVENATMITKLNVTDSCFLREMELLKANKETIGQEVTNLLALQALSVAAIRKAGLIRNSQASAAAMAECLANYEEPLPTIHEWIGIDQDVFSETIAEGIMARFRLEQTYKNATLFVIADLYRFLVQNFDGALRDKLIVYALTKHRRDNQAIEDLINDALTWVKDETCSQAILRLKHSNSVGVPAFDFSLPDTSGRYVRLSDFKGKKVLLDFWFTGCPPCKLLTRKMKQLEDRLQDNNTVFVSISTDKDWEKWKHSVRSGEYTTKHSVNLNAAYKHGASSILEQYAIVGYPTLILVDSRGNLMRYPINPVEDDGKDLLELIRSSE